MTRIELQVTEVDLSEMAGSIAEELRREHSGRKVDFHAEAGLRDRGDAGLLRSALMNLLQNAWKFTAKQELARIEFGTSQRDGARVYFVRDNGAGFDMAQADRLFGAFQRLHNECEFPGTGIGLATVRRIMRRHGGDAWAESTPGKGATFYFTLGSRPEMPMSAGGYPGDRSVGRRTRRHRRSRAGQRAAGGRRPRRADLVGTRACAPTVTRC